MEILEKKWKFEENLCRAANEVDVCLVGLATFTALLF